MVKRSPCMGAVAAIVGNNLVLAALLSFPIAIFCIVGGVLHPRRRRELVDLFFDRSPCVGGVGVHTHQAGSSLAWSCWGSAWCGCPWYLAGLGYSGYSCRFGKPVGHRGRLHRSSRRCPWSVFHLHCSCQFMGGSRRSLGRRRSFRQSSGCRFACTQLGAGGAACFPRGESILVFLDGGQAAGMPIVDCCRGAFGSFAATKWCCTFSIADAA
mmetsp:Transcript_58076/g.155191  ORF Transcript_58076/g.155191 Transcript_58076/m.155191 type:complete len:212 (-) Transcript_58076:4770-5405(-)